MKPVNTLIEELSYSEAMLRAYDGEDKDVRETLRTNIKAITEELKKRGYLKPQSDNN